MRAGRNAEPTRPLDRERSDDVAGRRDKRLPGRTCRRGDRHGAVATRPSASITRPRGWTRVTWAVVRTHVLGRAYLHQTLDLARGLGLRATLCAASTQLPLRTPCSSWTPCPSLARAAPAGQRRGEMPVLGAPCGPLLGHKAHASPLCRRRPGSGSRIPGGHSRVQWPLVPVGGQPRPYGRWGRLRAGVTRVRAHRSPPRALGCGATRDGACAMRRARWRSRAQWWWGTAPQQPPSGSNRRSAAAAAVAAAAAAATLSPVSSPRF